MLSKHLKNFYQLLVMAMINYFSKIGKLFKSFMFLKNEKEERLREYEIEVNRLRNQNEQQAVEIQSLRDLYSMSIRRIEEIDKEKTSLQQLLTDEQNLTNSLKEKLLSLEDELVRLRDTCGHDFHKTARVFSELINYCDLKKSLSDTSAEKTITSIIQRIEHSLWDYGIILKKEYVGTFDPAIHRIIEVVETKDASLHNQVAKVLSPGYWLNEQCLIPQDVAIYSFKS